MICWAYNFLCNAFVRQRNHEGAFKKTPCKLFRAYQYHSAYYKKTNILSIKEEFFYNMKSFLSFQYLTKKIKTILRCRSSLLFMLKNLVSYHDKVNRCVSNFVTIDNQYISSPCLPTTVHPVNMPDLFSYIIYHILYIIY